MERKWIKYKKRSFCFISVFFFFSFLRTEWIYRQKLPTLILIEMTWNWKDVQYLVYIYIYISCNRNGYALDGEKMTISAPCKRYFNQIFNENSSFWKYFTKFKLQNPICESFEACKFEKSHTLLQLQTNLFQHTHRYSSNHECICKLLHVKTKRERRDAS